MRPLFLCRKYTASHCCTNLSLSLSLTLSATGSKKAPKGEVKLNFRAINPSRKSVRHEIMYIITPMDFWRGKQRAVLAREFALDDHVNW